MNARRFNTRSILLMGLSAITILASDGWAQEAPAAAAPVVEPTRTTVAVEDPSLWSQADPTLWIQGQPVPPGYHVAQRPRRGLVGAGIAIFLVAYVPSVVLGGIFAGLLANSGHGDDGFYCTGAHGLQTTCSSAAAIPFFIPGVGGFFLAAGGGTGTLKAIGIADSLAQLGGITLITYGLVAKKTVLVRDRVGSDFTLLPMPFAGNGRAGLALGGTF
jgi:hypothetical protein